MKMAKNKTKSIRNKKRLVFFLFLVLSFSCNLTMSLAFDTSPSDYQPEFVPDDSAITYGSVSSGSLSDVETNNGNYWRFSSEYVSGMYEYVCSVEMVFIDGEQGKFDEIKIEVDISGTGNTYYVYVQYTDSTQSSAISLTDGTTVQTLESGTDYSSAKNVEGVKIFYSQLSSFTLSIDLCRAYEIDGIFCDSYTIHTGSWDSGNIDDTQAQDDDLLIFESSSKTIDVTLEFSTETSFERIYIYYEVPTWLANDDLELFIEMDEEDDYHVSVSSENTFIILKNDGEDFHQTDEVVSIRFYENKGRNWKLEIDYIIGFDWI